MAHGRRLSAGAELVGSGTSFRVWAPKRKTVTVVLDDGRTVPLDHDADDAGYFAGFADGVMAGARYRLRLDADPQLYPDPRSRFQPEGPHGPSEVIDPSFRWTDAAWKGIPSLKGQVVYELHIGTFTKEGTFRSAMRELDELRRLGITLLEIMPIAEFPGEFGWGYDGVDLYAPTRLYGRPDDFRAFVDRCHAVGLGVILDVVYNHLGPSGNYLTQFSDHFFTEKYENEWGAAIDFETEANARAYFAENGGYWIDEFHLDGLRLDATQSIHDASETHVIEELVSRARAKSEKPIVVVAENEPQHPKLVREMGVDALWNDDFHHSARVAVTGCAEAYYSSTKGTPQELISAIKWGYLFQGQHYPWQKASRGAPGLDLAPEQFVLYTQNHDQVANAAGSPRIDRLTTPGRVRALTTLQLLAPGTPMLFMGQEMGASQPFHYFADHEPELAALVRKGRLEFMAQFPSMDAEAMRAREIAPDDRKAFESCILDFSERETHREIYELHRELLRLRREDPIFSAQDRDHLHGAVLADEALVLRFGTGSGEDRLVVVTFGHEIDVAGIAEPLLAPVEDRPWHILFSTEDPRFGGRGQPDPHASCLRVPGHAAIVLAPSKKETP